MQLDRLARDLGVPDLIERLQVVERRLQATLEIDAPSLSTASARVAGAGGKRLRPALTIAIAELGGLFDESVIAAAVAVELVQVGSLVHDDIFEDAATRRGVPTINRVEGANHALLAGDFILARAGSEAASAGQGVAQEVAATIVALCEGQLAEMRHTFDVDRPVDSYFASIAGKTGALFACACRAGARCAGMRESDVDAVGRFGLEFGNAFQVLDDVLDLVADPDRLGKPVGIDLATGVYTLPVLRALDGPDGGRLRSLLSARTAAGAAEALRIVADSEAVPDALRVAKSIAVSAANALDSLDGPVAACLRTFPGDYLDWALRHFTAGRLPAFSG